MANLLLVDDEKDLLDSIDQLLTFEGHQTRALSSGEEVVAALADPEFVKPDLIITDIIMPGMNGFDLLDYVRAQPDYKRVPFLFISASVMPSVEQQLAQTEAVYYLRKPFDIEALCNLVESVCASP